MKPSDADLGDTTGVPESPGVKATRSSGPPLHTSGASIDPLAMTGTSSGQATARVGRPGFDVDAELARAQLETRLYGAGRGEGGPRIGKYQILDHLGRGGMGSVYTVYNPDLDRKSVIKLVRPDRSSPDSRRRLLREARLTATLSHPNVVQIHDSGEYLDEIYVVMEFIAGVDLDAWRRQGPHAWPEVLAVYRQAGLGLAAAHAQGVVHRDFTPRNAMLGEDGRVRVLDFGLAHARRDAGEVIDGAPGSGGPRPAAVAVSDAMSEPGSGDSLTATGAIVGTPRYMSPEQLRSVPTDGRSDQFSFCVALWEALLGHLPFMGADLFEYNEAALAGDIRPPEDLRGVPRRVLKALRRGLAPRADDRFADMHALLAELDVRPLRPWIGLAGVAGALALVGLWFLALPATPVSPREQCASELADELPVTWSALPGPIAGRLGEFADRWRAARVELCAAGVAGGLPAPALRRGLRCLAQQRAVFDLVVDRVTAGDALELDLGALPDSDRVAACTDPLRLADGAAPPSPAAREAVSRVEADLARAETALILGRYAESEAIAASAVRRVREIGHAPTLAAALYQLARAETYGPNADAAEATLREAAGLAERHDLHDLAADIYLRLVRVAMAHGQRSADGSVVRGPRLQAGAARRASRSALGGGARVPRGDRPRRA
ncbi:serine/threonine-protein kinase [Nannocystis sp.]|uniref:serine/threonine-protein kinase n=1 Tax=Nannocystis sp. TaxID=1962667 RepID=UPI0025CD4BAC|nr:serine/threonine-protein kinase [Nannocystis sp.]MBK7826520.1 serine/threonine protein kinase [Nannocystis sp.]